MYVLLLCTKIRRKKDEQKSDFNIQLKQIKDFYFNPIRRKTEEKNESDDLYLWAKLVTKEAA